MTSFSLFKTYSSPKEYISDNSTKKKFFFLKIARILNDVCNSFFFWFLFDYTYTVLSNENRMKFLFFFIVELMARLCILFPFVLIYVHKLLFSLLLVLLLIIFCCCSNLYIENNFIIYLNFKNDNYFNNNNNG
jgi:hypothetical protein